MESSDAYSVPTMAYILQSRTSTVGERITALRSLKQHLEENHAIDAYNKKRIKQLILDNVLQMILSEEKVTNVVKRQLVRTELFLILAKLLDSNVLFGSILSQSSNGDESVMSMESVHEYDSVVDSVNRPPPPNRRSSPPRTANAQALTVYHGSPPRSGADVGQSGPGARVLQPPGGWVKKNNSKHSHTLTSHGSNISLLTSSQAGSSHNLHSPTRMQHSSSTGGLPAPSYLDSYYATEERLGSPAAGSSRNRSRASSRSATMDLTLLKPLLKKQARSQSKSVLTAQGVRVSASKTWKPRPSVLHSELVADSFVPGADPMNYFEQDRKLGYQKPRMWFPGGFLNNQTSLVPDQRAAAVKEPAKGGSEQVVREYLQMKSLASYVGDLVQPFAGSKASYMTAASSPVKPGTTNSVKSTSSRLAGLTDNARFNAVLQEIASVWSPLLGVHLPPQHQQAALPGTSNHRKRKLHATSSQGSDATYASEYAQEILPFKCLRVDAAHTSKIQARKRQLLEQDNLRTESKLLSKSVRSATGGDNEQDGEGNVITRTKQYQYDVSSYLQLQKDHVMASIRATERLIAATLKSNYHIFKPKYLLLLEGDKANARATIASAMVIFCRVKRCNFLALAFGTWKILLVEMASVARRPMYSRIAACYLMARWQQEVHMKKLRIWIVRWRRRAGQLIFIQRNREVLIIQTLFRTWRDRRKFIHMHLTKTFQGVLSDIYLGPKRKGLPFFVPDIIRNDRRLLWLAATIIQTVFRCYDASKEFFHKRRMVVLLQSIIRMFPRYRKFKRLRATTIKCQAWARRTVKRKQFKRLKRATIIVQKYVRRYLSILRKLRTFAAIWRAAEQPLAAVIKIQCRYRIRLAKKKVRGKRFVIAKRKYSALVIQRNYYRYKKAFHTFFLMCCLREREVEDIKVIKRKAARGRHRAARVIQKFYRRRYFKRNISAIVKVQCWFRGRMGYGLVDILRKERWASRKIRSWVKVRVRRREHMARRIQRWWWGNKEGRLRRHLWWLLQKSDQQDDYERSEKRYFAAMRIQAYVKGVWDRRWVRRLRAALIIQRNARFFFGMKRWRRWKREKIMKVVRRYAAYAQEKALKNVLARTLKKHSDNMRRPQALVRGYLLRNVMKNARWVAYMMGMAVVRIQRCWRQSGAMGKAVEEVLALKRERSNPFVPCDSAHEVLVMMRRQTRVYFSTYDPRAGMRVSALLYRLGCMELLDMFPRKNYVTVSDMSGLTMHKLNELYESMKARLEKAGNKQDKNVGSVKIKKKQPIPTALFETILSIVTPPLFTCDRRHRDKIRAIMSMAEYEAPAAAMEGFKKVFQRKFGKNLNARAEHMAKDLLNMIWGDFANYKLVGAVVTKPQIIKAINASPDSNNPLQALEDIRARPNGAVDEKKWDKERIAKCAEVLQLAVDRLSPLLPPGKLKTMVERANNRVTSYRRKVDFVRKRLILAANASAAPSTAVRRGSVASINSEATGNSTVGNSTITPVKGPGGSTMTPNGDVNSPGMGASVSSETRGALDLTTPEILNHVLPIARSLEIPFTSNVLADLELDCDIGICRVFFDVLDKLYMMTCAVQSLKNSWHNNALRRAVTQQKILQFKSSVKLTYLNDRQDDKVKKVWLKHKRIETSKKKLDIIMKAVYARKAAAKFELSFVPRHGWISLEDANGYSYWFDTKPRGAAESTYDIPVYNLRQYFLLLKVQRASRLFLERLHERKVLREAEEQAEIARMEAIMEEERKKGARLVKTKYSLVARVLDSAGEGHVHKKKSHHHSTVPSLDEIIPWKFRFQDKPTFKSGHWALLKHHLHSHEYAEGETVPLTAQYDIVVIFRLKADEDACDVRNIKGKCTRNVHLNRLFQMNLDVGQAVETRYKQEKVFYRSVITRADHTMGQDPIYSIRYEDGEAVTGLQRDAIRPSQATLRTFLRGREQHLHAAKPQLRRMVHFDKLRKERLQGYEARLRDLQQAQAANNLSLKNGSQPPSRPESPMMLEDLSRPGSPMLALEGGRTSPTEDVSQALVVAEGEAPSEETSTALVTATTTATTNAAALGSTAVVVPKYRVDIKIRLPFARVCNVYGWKTIQDYNSEGRKYFYYENPSTGEMTDTQPTYTALEVQYARRIQFAWLLHSARLKVRRKVLRLDIVEMIRATVKKCSKIAYVGFELEGITSMQIMRRAGYWELAEILEAFYKGMKWSIHNLTIEEIIRKPKDEYENFGILQPQHQRELREFQVWWGKVTTQQKQKSLALFNYFKSPDDERDIKACILQSEEIMVAKFMKYIKTGSARTREAVQMVVSDSHFPHSHLQIETYLKRYNNKAEMARELVFEITNKPTTHTWVEERVVLRHYRFCTRLIAAILSNLRLKHLRMLVAKVEKQVERIMKTAPRGANRLLCTGPEAKAALALRIGVFQYFTNYIHAVHVVQRNVRCYLLSKKWSIFLIARTRGIDLLQRTARRYLAVKSARILTAQKLSEWEQLWDSRRNLLYYYNHITGQSQYNEPDCPFRPLVRDPLSAMLIQAWPELDNRNGALALLPISQGSSTVPMQASHTHCGICHKRKCVRICTDCTDEIEFDPLKNYYFPYCFTCYMKEHNDDNAARANHNFIMMNETDTAAGDAAGVVEQMVLRCCMCDELATRKCMGLLDEDQIDSICNELRRTAPEGWVDVLKASNVAGDRKLTILLDQIRSESSAAVKSVVAFQAAITPSASPEKSKSPSPHKGKHGKTEKVPEVPPDNGVIASPNTKLLSVAHLQEIRTLLERSRAECDECYCAGCYKEVHAGGKRALHKWKGFQALAAICSVCTNSPAELNCFDCEYKYCASCYKVFHGMGRKRNHKRERILETLQDNQVYCGLCERRAADTTCSNDRCHASACDSCIEFKHLPQCSREIAIMGGSPSTRNRKVGNNDEHSSPGADERPHTPSKAARSAAADVDPDACVVCGEEADQKCMQCGDCYCSRTWMGNPGCFAQHHSRGNRASHTAEPFFSRRALVASMKRSKSMRASRKSLVSGADK